LLLILSFYRYVTIFSSSVIVDVAFVIFHSCPLVFVVKFFFTVASTKGNTNISAACVNLVPFFMFHDYAMYDKSLTFWSVWWLFSPCHFCRCIILSLVLPPLLKLQQRCFFHGAAASAFLASSALYSSSRTIHISNETKRTVALSIMSYSCHRVFKWFLLHCWLDFF